MSSTGLLTVGRSVSGKQKKARPCTSRIYLQTLLEHVHSENGVEHLHNARPLAVADRVEHLLHLFRVGDGHLEKHSHKSIKATTTKTEGRWDRRIGQVWNIRGPAPHPLLHHFLSLGGVARSPHPTSSRAYLMDRCSIPCKNPIPWILPSRAKTHTR